MKTQLDRQKAHVALKSRPPIRSFPLRHTGSTASGINFCMTERDSASSTVGIGTMVFGLLFICSAMLNFLGLRDPWTMKSTAHGTEGVKDDLALRSEVMWTSRISELPMALLNWLIRYIPRASGLVDRIIFYILNRGRELSIYSYTNGNPN